MKKRHLFIFFLILFSSCKENKDTNTINILTNEIISANYIGNGVQWDAYPHADSETAEWGKLMTDKKWEKVFERLDYMKPKLVRSVDQANWRYLKGFDKDGKPILDFDSEEEQALIKLLTYCEENEITVLLGEYGCPYQVHDLKEGFSGILKGANDSVWHDMIVQHLDFLINKKGFTCIKYFNLVNEPNGNWASTDGNWTEWSEGAKMLAAKIKEAGLDKQISIAGPDVVAPWNHPKSEFTGMQWVLKSARKLNTSIGALEIHDYFDPEVIIKEQFKARYKDLVRIADSINKPIFFGEVGFGKSNDENQKRAKADPFASKDSQMRIYDYSYGIDMADALIQIMNTGFQGAAAWALDDAMHTNGDDGNKNNLKRWGMWNSLGKEICNNPKDEELRPWFYTWSLMCRYIKRGSKIVKVQIPNSTKIRVSAAIKDENLTVSLLNRTEKTETITLSEKNFTRHKNFKIFNFIEGNSKTDENDYPVPTATNLEFDKNGNLELVVKKNSFVLITTYKY